MNLAMAYMYRSGFWLPQAEGKKLSEWILHAMQGYSLCARVCLQEGRSRYALIPKLHFICHASWRLHSESVRSRFCVNPLAESVQMQEDYIGKPARLSRRVDVRLIHLRVLERTLICSRGALETADSDDRGLQRWKYAGVWCVGGWTEGMAV